MITVSYRDIKTKLTQIYGLFVDVRSQNLAFSKKLTQKWAFRGVS